ncbi:HTH-type transcriptional regulator PrtR [compost metagenome]
MLRVRYLYKLPGGGIRIRSENSDEYPDELLTRKDCIRIKMLGRVFWWSTIRRSPPR